VRVAVAETGPERAVIGLTSEVAAHDRWSRVEVPLARAAVRGEHLNVNVAVEPGREVAVRRIALS
jgi:hypothetical protein